MTSAMPKQLELPAPKLRPWWRKKYTQRLERELMLKNIAVQALRRELESARMELASLRRKTQGPR